MSNIIYKCPGCRAEFELSYNDFYRDAKKVEMHLITCSGEYANSIECDSCYYRTRNLSLVRPDWEGDGEVRAHCEICYSTPIGSMTRYTEQYDHSVTSLGRALAYIANTLMDKA